MYCFDLSGKFNKHSVVGDMSPACVAIDLILGGYFRHILNCYDVRFKRATQNWFP